MKGGGKYNDGKAEKVSSKRTRIAIDPSRVPCHELERGHSESTWTSWTCTYDINGNRHGRKVYHDIARMRCT
jgi:hypothetical protein